MDSLEAVEGEATPEAFTEDGPPALADELSSEASRELEAARGENAALLGRLRVALAETIAGLDAEAISGESLAEVEASFAAAKAVEEALRRAVARERTAAIPPGAPGRAGYLPATPFEKIRAGLGRLPGG